MKRSTKLQLAGYATTITQGLVWPDEVSLPSYILLGVGWSAIGAGMMLSALGRTIAKRAAKTLHGDERTEGMPRMFFHDNGQRVCIIGDYPALVEQLIEAGFREEVIRVLRMPT